MDAALYSHIGHSFAWMHTCMSCVFLDVASFWGKIYLQQRPVNRVVLIFDIHSNYELQSEPFMCNYTKPFANSLVGEEGGEGFVLGE